jgi:hypothetical protein
MHPRDMDTWLELDEMEASEARLALARQETRRAMGPGWGGG